MRIRYVALTAAMVGAALLFSAAPAHADPSLEEVEQQVKEKGEELEKVIEEYNGAKEKLEDAEEQQKKLEGELKPMEDAVTLAQQEIDQIASATYTGGSLSRLNIMLSGTPDDTIERLAMISQLGQTQAIEINDFNTATTDLQDQLAAIEDTIKEQEDLKKEIGEKKDKIEGELDDLKALQDELTPVSQNYDVPDPPSGRAGEAVQFAYDQLGEPYSYGSGGPDSWDCSGLTQGAWGAAGESLSHNAAMQWDETQRISRGDLVPGDLVFYNNLGHVAIFVGDGTIVHAPTSGQTVSAADIDSMAIDGYGRV